MRTNYQLKGAPGTSYLLHPFQQLCEDQPHNLQGSVQNENENYEKYQLDNSRALNQAQSPSECIHTQPIEQVLEETKGQRSQVTFPKSHSKFGKLWNYDFSYLL